MPNLNFDADLSIKNFYKILTDIKIDIDIKIEVEFLEKGENTAKTAVRRFYGLLLSPLMSQTFCLYQSEA